MVSAFLAEASFLCHNPTANIGGWLRPSGLLYVNRAFGPENKKVTCVPAGYVFLQAELLKVTKSILTLPENSSDRIHGCGSKRFSGDTPGDATGYWSVRQFRVNRLGFFLTDSIGLR